MSTNIGAKVTLDGEQAYKKALQDINAQCKALGSEMKLTTAQFANNAKSQDALKAKTEVLTKQIEAQSKKTELLKDNYNRLSKELGENDEKTQKARKAYLDSATSLQKMQNEASGASKETKDLGSSMDGTSDKAHKFREALGTIGKVAAAGFATVATAVTAVSTALAKGIKDTAEYGDNIDKMSQKLGLSSKSYQEWDYVIQLAGADIDSMQTGLKTLTNKLDDAKNGSQDATAMFNKLGISTEELKTLNREEIFKKTINGFQRMADTTDRAALANDLFGKSGQNLTPLFNQSVEETDKLIKQFNDLGGVMSDDAVKASAKYQDSLKTMQLAFTGLRNNMTSEFLPSVTKVMDGISKLVSGQDGGIQSISDGIQELASSITRQIPKFVELAGSIIKGLAKGILSNIPTIVRTAKEIINSLVRGLSENVNLVMNAVIDIVMTFAEIIIDNLPIILDTALQIILALLDGLVNNIDKIIDGAIAIINAIADGISLALPKLIPAVIMVINEIVGQLLVHLPELINCGMQLLFGILDGILNALFGDGGASATATDTVDELSSQITSEDNIETISNAGGSLVESMFDGFLDGLPEAVANAVPTILAAVAKAIWGLLKGFFYLGVRIGNAIIHGITGNEDEDSYIQPWADGEAKKGEKALKKAWEIASPSKRTARVIGKPIAQGIRKGFDEEMKEVTKDMQSNLPSLSLTAHGSATIRGVGGLTINNNNTFNSATDRDANRLIRLTNRSLGLAYGGV